MALAPADLTVFAADIRRLRDAGELPLYPAYRALLQAAYPHNCSVDSVLRAPGAGFPDFTSFGFYSSSVKSLSQPSICSTM